MDKPLPRLALLLEYPLALRGGVSVLVETLIPHLASTFRIVLVSPDTRDSLAIHPQHRLIDTHVEWPTVDRKNTGAELAKSLLNLDVSIAHFHCGGIYGWNIRIPGQSAVSTLSRAGVRCFWTSHLVVSPLNGYCGPAKPAWLKYLLWPGAWLGKLDEMRGVEKEIAVSESDAEKLRRWYFPMSGRVQRVYHSRIQSLGNEEAVRAEGREKIVLNVGHIAFRKGQHVLAEAFASIAAQHPEWSLHLAGHDAGDGCFDYIQRFIKSHGLEDRILLLGQQGTVVDLLRRASIYAQPSFYEGLPLALQEAIASGLPALGTSIGGIGELVENGVNGFLVPPNDAPALAERIHHLISNPSLRDSLGAAGPRIISEKGMTVAAMVHHHLDLYRSKTS